MCRSYHLILLRHNLQKAGLSLRGTVAGEALDSWKSKVSRVLAKSKEGVEVLYMARIRPLIYLRV